jgi:hypothetical protein
MPNPIEQKYGYNPYILEDTVPIALPSTQRAPTDLSQLASALDIYSCRKLYRIMDQWTSSDSGFSFEEIYQCRIKNAHSEDSRQYYQAILDDYNNSPKARLDYSGDFFVGTWEMKYSREE